MTEKPIAYYHYRGLIERGGARRLRWHNGYSESGQRGCLYPWMTFRECQKDAAARGMRAMFTKR